MLKSKHHILKPRHLRRLNETKHHINNPSTSISSQLPATHCNTLPNTASRCIAPQSSQCKALQHTARLCNIISSLLTHCNILEMFGIHSWQRNMPKLRNGRRNYPAWLVRLRTASLRLTIACRWDVLNIRNMCDMTHSYVWHDSFICVTWLIHMCDMTHSYVWHDSFICVTWLMWDVLNIRTSHVTRMKRLSLM